MACILEIRTSVSCCPKKKCQKLEIGDPVEVFLYKDSADRLIATTREPKIKLGEVKTLTVADTGRIGAFLDWGLPKDLLLPFKEQTGKVAKGDQVLVSLYIDKSGRLCATMKVYEMLRTDAPIRRMTRWKGSSMRPVNGLAYLWPWMTATVR